MIELMVKNSIDQTLMVLRRRLASDGIFRELRLRNGFPKRSARIKQKQMIATLRRKKNEKKRRRYEAKGER